MKMKIFCIVMVVLFTMIFCASFVGIFVEWNAGCNACTFDINPETNQPYATHHPTQCNILMRARIHSIFTTAILGICSVMWCILLWDAYADVRLQHQWAQRITGGDYSHLDNMAECFEKRQR